MCKINYNIIFRSIFICMMAGIFSIMSICENPAQATQVFRVYKEDVSGKIPEKIML